MITAIIPTRNDPMLTDTINSMLIGANSDPSLGVVVVNDAGEEPVIYADIQLINNEHNLGPAISRHLGSRLGDGDWLLFCDSHMIFPDGWYKLVCPILERANREDVFCSVFQTDVIDNSIFYDTHLMGGADFYFWRHHLRDYSFAGLSPRRVSGISTYIVPCVNGACYFVNREWFNSIDGFSILTGYGSEEPWLSWNSWLAGGEVKVIGSLPVIHRHQGKPKLRYSLIQDQELNRLAVLRRVLTVEQFDEFCSWLPINSFIKHQVMIKNIQPHDELGIGHNEICAQFGLQTFEEAIELMREYNSRK
jgi:Glycosyl transferase family 2.